jgi:uncharacterized protein YjbI with pentapeptide repeats
MAQGVAKTPDLSAPRDAVNQAANRSRGLWLGYIALVAYLFITVGAVTHRDLMLQSPVRLPVLNVDLPLVGFFAVAPLFFLINHFYLLLNLLGLSRRIQEFNAATEAAGLPEKPEKTERRRLDTFVIVQMLGGTKEERQDLTGLMLRVIAWITLVIAPVTLLLFIQLQFLPHQSEALTWWHRIALLIDLILISIFWPAIRKDGRPRFLLANPALLASFPIVLFSCLVATFPGERADGGPKATDWKQEQDSVYWTVKAIVFGSLVGPPDERWPGLPFLSRTLHLADNQALIDYDTFDKIRRRYTGDDRDLDPWDERQTPWQSQRTLSLRSRNLRGAVFDRSDLRNADFEATKLQGASLDNARLQGALLIDARLQGASLNGARLQGALLTDARLQGASLIGARLQGVPLDRARLQGAELIAAKLQGASLDGARLQGASLTRARLQGASLVGARLQGASLDGARLQGASLDGAWLQGASLNGAKLQGTLLGNAKLQGAALDGARLQGALLSGAELRGASFRGTGIWRVFGRPDHIRTGEVLVENPRFVPLLPETIKRLEILALSGVESEEVKKNIQDLLARLSAAKDNLEDLLVPKSFWRELEARKDVLIYGRTLTDILEATACDIEDAEDAPHAALGLIWRHRLSQRKLSRLEAVGPLHLPNLAKHLLDAAEGRRDDCPGVKGLDEESIARLRKWAKPLENQSESQP